MDHRYNPNDLTPEDFAYMYHHYINDGFYYAMDPARMTVILRDLFQYYYHRKHIAQCDKILEVQKAVLTASMRRGISISSVITNETINDPTDGGYTWVGKVDKFAINEN